MSDQLDPATVRELVGQLERLQQSALEGARAVRLDNVASRHRASACNLAHYLALRRSDLRELQVQLARHGLSSLGRCEAHVLSSIESVLGILRRLLGETPSEGTATIDFDWGEQLLSDNASNLLGEIEGRRGRIMVTMPTQAATDPTLLEELLRSGMDLMRINCAHDDADAWCRMVENLERARDATGRACAIYADLAGPKLRTALDGEARHVEVGETILLHGGLAASRGPGPQRVGCTLPEAVAALQPGQHVYIDDGKITCVVTEKLADAAALRILGAVQTEPKIKNDAGINLPETVLEVACLTHKDRGDLEFIVEHADLVGLSFVRRVEDVSLLLKELERRGTADLGIVLKVETNEAFKALPELLVAAQAAERCGVMVARGDLAVEIGFERLAEVQEEILWLCEAAHVPTIWATQVLDQMARKGLPSRAEVTDAAMAGRAECVMLNKGPHICSAVEFLDGVMRRMEGHRSKRRALLRRLSVAG